MASSRAQPLRPHWASAATVALSLLQRSRRGRGNWAKLLAVQVARFAQVVVRASEFGSRPAGSKTGKRSTTTSAWCEPMVGFLLWLLLRVLCWPLALLALVLYPIVWLILLPFRLVGIAVGGVLELVRSIVFLPARVPRLRGRQGAL
jgi:hypothetical protein